MGNFARIAAISSFFPEGILDNERISQMFPEWSVEKISDKTGINSRHISGEDEYSSDLGASAARKLFDSTGVSPADIEYLIVCTQSPDFFLPSTAAIIQHQLGLSRAVAAIDVNLGCSGYVYCLGLAKGLIETNQVSNVLLVTTDTWSKFINPGDKSVRTIFGDGATATLIVGDADAEQISGLHYGTDGSGAGDLMVPRGGLRPGELLSAKAAPSQRGLEPSKHDLYMDGPAIFNFTLDVVPSTIQAVLEKTGMTESDVDFFVFHQANRFMLEHLRRKLGIDESKFPIRIENCGNTISSTIPLVLEKMASDGLLQYGKKTITVGFGVGLSWAGAMISWTESPIVAM